MSAALRQPELVRAFFAIELDKTARAAAGRVAGVLRKSHAERAVRWVRPENFHVTLRFLGNVESGSLAELAGHVAEALAGSRPFELALGAAHGFPKPKQPRAVVLDLEPKAPVVALAAAVERGAVTSGLRRESKRFRAHLTLGRVRRDVKARDLHFEGERSEAVLFPVREVVLFRSQLTQQGPEYTALERIPLGVLVHPFSKDLED